MPASTPTQLSQQAAQYLLRRMLGPQAQFRPGQWEAIEALVKDRARLLVVQRTGWGKSLVYFMATKLLRAQGAGPTILVSPLLSLMRNQIQAMAALGLRPGTVNSTNYDEHDEVEARALAGEIDLLLLSPERLGNDHFRAEIWPRLRQQVGMLVVDEAHCISDWGHDFRPNYRRIVRVVNELPPGTPVLGTTATANERVIEDVRRMIGGDGGMRVLRGPLARESLMLHAFTRPLSTPQRLVLLEQLLKRYPGSGIIYCLTTADCMRVAGWLQHAGLNVKPYFADVQQVTGERREDLEQELLDNRVKALAASVALGMGFDKPDLAFVIHYQRPGSIIAYYQQIGRAGRGIDAAHIVLMPGLEDEDVHRYFIETAFPTPEQVEAVVAALAEHGALSRRDLQKRVNVRSTALEKILLHLEVDEVIAWKDAEYAAVNPDNRPDYARWERVTAQRYAEMAQMNAYLSTPGCLMQYLAAALDDQSATEPCGRCANCAGRSSLKQPTREQIDAASRFLRDGKPLTFEPRKQWPNRFSETLKGRFKSPNEVGVALCQYHDQGYGDLVKRGKYQDGRFCDELVDAAASLLRDHWQNLDAPPRWATAVPSRRHPTLVPDFAERLAGALGLPFSYVVEKIADRPEQKTMQNPYQQVQNLLEAFGVCGVVRNEPVLLVDDMIDSGWTFAVVGELLRQHGSGAVHPFALAKVGFLTG
ncbi:MAG: RecQ family ATP-dependent DNA helicase [Anaerolineae bacterium]|nr:RecQ family ATP-dependent DNA helicase [Anaerolineae bacterium]